jgi:hypothetical protein
MRERERERGREKILLHVKQYAVKTTFLNFPLATVVCVTMFGST